MSEKGPFGIFQRPFRSLLRGQTIQITDPLYRLYKMQDELIEHKFPHEYAQIMDNIISAAGDIYREMAGGSYKHAPHYGYIEEKWARLTEYTSARIPYLTEGDMEEIKRQIQDPTYSARRNEYFRNLNILREETQSTPMDDKRKDVMIAALDLIEHLIVWFESLDPKRPPTQQMGKLTDTIARYFPEKFWEEQKYISRTS